MAKVRVYELAKSMGIPSGQLLEELRVLGISVESNFSTLDETAMVQLMDAESEAAEETAPEAIAQTPVESSSVRVEEEADTGTAAKAATEEPSEQVEEEAKAAEPLLEGEGAKTTPEEAPEADEPAGDTVEVAEEVAAEVPAAASGKPPEKAGAPDGGKSVLRLRIVERPEPAKVKATGKPGRTKVENGRAPREAGKVTQKEEKTGGAPRGKPEKGPETAKKPPGRYVREAVHRKSKRERRLNKVQSRADRQERLQRELDEAKAKAESGEAIFIRDGITVKELADKLNVKVKDIISKLMMRGVLATINKSLDGQVAVEVSSLFGYQAEIISYEDELALTQEDVSDEEKEPRSPVVTVMGHVDHGKSSLLEAIHNIHITNKEFGGITQHIGAYKVNAEGKEYVFLDTPGHEAFTLMRARGAQVTDVVVLVVAADDGVMPQTIEAINHCKAAKVPIIVAINKMDKAGADPEKVKKELSQHGVLLEDWGGDVVSVQVSAKTHEGVPEMLEMISLVADMLNLEAAPGRVASGAVLESKLDRAKGPVATVLIQDGTLHIGDTFLCGASHGHVRGLIDDTGQRIEEAVPSTPVEVMGFSEVPEVGSLFQVMTDEAKARQIASFRRERAKEKDLRSSRVSLDSVLGAIEEGKIQELGVVLKADVFGSLEVVAAQITNLSTDEVKINIIHKGVGAISESDVALAAASKAVILGFNVRPDKKASQAAKAESVDVSLFTVIYNLVERMKQALSGMLKPIEEESILGQAEIKQIFRVSKIGTVAGCMVTGGHIKKDSKIRILRDNVVVHIAGILSLKHFKDDVSEVKEGTECGISLVNFNDIKPGDVLEAFEITFTERTL